MEEFEFSDEVIKILIRAQEIAEKRRLEFVTPELFLMLALDNTVLRPALMSFDIDVKARRLSDNLWAFLESMERVPDGLPYTVEISKLLQEVISTAKMNALYASRELIELSHMLNALLDLPSCVAGQWLNKAVEGRKGELISRLLEFSSRYKGYYEKSLNAEIPDYYFTDSEVEKDSTEPEVAADKVEEEDIDPDDDVFGADPFDTWRHHVTCVNDIVDKKNPLVGREEELERTIRTLCRKDKNNPLHIGDPGVGKTSIVYGLARRIISGDVPGKLRGARIYSLDVSSLLAGTQYRGDFESRVKSIMDGVSKETNPIIHIDEIHGLVGAGATADSSLDASNMLKPYLEEGKIRFIGTTTFDEYNRHLARSKGFIRRFQQIEIKEPSQEETIRILMQLKPAYESFHGVKYDDEAIRAAVSGSARHISDRFLPDKAIDVIDEAGAYRQTHRTEDSTEEGIVDKALVNEILAKMCKVERLAEADENNNRLYSLKERIEKRVFGQDDAIRAVSEAVLMAKAGLTDETKPLASLLFVGPTGVGKTEVAKVLSEEMGVGLVRFDMSEYTEKHAVAKLIGSPAGYVGYEDGGLLTDAIRRNPECVLLLDEIEKAHPDIYNILLQVMDYGRLTDNRGNTADFRNIIVIMTSNAGAQYASRASLGFESHVTSGQSMLAQVKKTFKPEFINRLSATVVFNDMTREMAALILDKKLGELRKRLARKNVELSLSHEAEEWILKAGVTREYGAREIERVIASRLSPILMREILFGNLKGGGRANVDVDGDALILR